MKAGKRILVTPLDWGLGHATRCVPIIRLLLQKGCSISLAGSGDSLLLLSKEFPDLPTFQLPAYKPVYPKQGSMVWKMAQQLPRLVKVIEEEKKETDKIVEREGIELIISDNRYGCYSENITSVMINHQVNILMPVGWKWMEPIVNRFNHKLLKRFKHVFYPAPMPGTSALFPQALACGHEKFNTTFIGFLSRFEKMSLPEKYDLAVICSGPEPQRSLFEEKMIKQLQGSNTKAILVKGKPDSAEPRYDQNDNITIVNYLNAEGLNKVIEESRSIISRSGYSAIMDMAKLGKHAIFIPTPGQTEQEYLAAELMSAGIAYSMDQKTFNLEKALKESENYKGFKTFEWNDDLLENAINKII